MSAIGELETTMYATLFIVFAIGFAVIYVIMLLLGVSSIGIIAIALLFFLAQWYLTPYIIKFASKLRYIGDEEYPKLQKMVADLSAQAGIPKPKIAISPSQEPNAFVFGRSTKGASLAVHEGLLKMVNDDELNAVLAHEIGHIKHKDFIVITIVSFVPMLAYIVAESLFLNGMFSSGGRNNNTGYLVVLGIGAFVVYFISELLMMSLTRERELFADSYSADSTSKPQYLASALVKITYGLNGTESQGPAANNGTVTRSLYIADNLTAGKDLAELDAHAAEIKRLLPNINISELKANAAKERKGARGFLNSLFGTHPSTYKRLILLAQMADERNGK